jgi:hypothetical protein
VLILDAFVPIKVGLVIFWCGKYPANCELAIEITMLSNTQSQPFDN